MVIILFLILVGNLFVMMVLRHGYYKDQALENRQVRFRVRAPRGLILDRDGVILADNMLHRRHHRARGAVWRPTGPIPPWPG